MAILVGIERCFITRQQGFERLNQIIDWLNKTDRYHGVWPHWMDGRTGETDPFVECDDGGDLVETSFLVQGMLCVRQYFNSGNSAERDLVSKIDKLWREVEWDWYRGPDMENVLYWKWSPSCGWNKSFPIQGWNEALITYVLAASSPTHGVPANVYHEGWAQADSAVSRQYNDINTKPLFWSHYSFLGLDPRGLNDRYADYWNQSVNHALYNHDYCVENPNNSTGYGKDCWGLTASYSINSTENAFAYAAHSPENDLGVISPTAALSSFPYTPNESMAAMRHFFDDLGEKLWGPYGFYDAFSQEDNFYPPRYLAIDQGPTVVMMENHRTGKLWELFMTHPRVKEGLSKLGFTTATTKEEEKKMMHDAAIREDRSRTMAMMAESKLVICIFIIVTAVLVLN
jgi:hypothetical protein